MTVVNNKIYYKDKTVLVDEGGGLWGKEARSAGTHSAPPFSQRGLWWGQRLAGGVVQLLNEG